MASVHFLLFCCIVHPALGAIQEHSLSVSPSGKTMRNHREGEIEPDVDNAHGDSGKYTASNVQGTDVRVQQGCAPLKSHGVYYSVDIKVGTPPQTFSVVADTGSDAVIIPSCVCQEHGFCSKKDRCFRGTNKSKTFSIMGLNSSNKHPHLPVIKMFFGSGEIEAIVASDVVNVGGVHHLMNNSIMLMVNKFLRVSGPFEGILGLGPPKNSSVAPMFKVAKSSSEVQESKGLPVAQSLGKILQDAMSKNKGNMEDVVGDLAYHYPTALGQLSMKSSDVRYWPFGIPKPHPKKHGFQPLGFDEVTHTASFSMCFNDMGTDGALNLNHPKAKKNSLLAIGKEHWSLDFRGISVGKSGYEDDAPVKFCAPNMKEEGAKTACGAIPDSGTTLIMAPRDHVEKLFGDICDNWERCKTAVGQGLQHFKLQIFQMLLHNCGSWVAKNGEKNSTLHELPDLHFHLAGMDGKKNSITLTGDDYIIETMEDEVHMVTRNVFGMPLRIPQKTGKMKRVCAPAFSTMEMKTHDNGHVWILGGPVFYKYTVSYVNDPKAPAISFHKQKCGCDSDNSALVASPKTPKDSGMREMHSDPRLPSFDLKFPNGL